MKERLCLEVEHLILSVVIMGSKGFEASRRTSKGRLGSVSDYCVRYCVCPVVVVRYPDDGVEADGGSSTTPRGSAENDTQLHHVLEEDEFHDTYFIDPYEGFSEICAHNEVDSRGIHRRLLLLDNHRVLRHLEDFYKISKPSRCGSYRNPIASRPSLLWISHQLPLYLILGMLCGAVSVAFSHLVVWFTKTFEFIKDQFALPTFCRLVRCFDYL